MVTTPAAATAAVRATAVLRARPVGPGAANRPCAPRHVDVPAHALQGCRDHEQRHIDRRAGFGPPPLRHRRGRAGFGGGRGAGTPPEDVTHETSRALEASQQALAEGAKRHRGEAAVANMSAPPATSKAAEASSAPRAAFTSSSAPSAALTTRLGSPPQPPFNEMTIIRRHRRFGDQAFLKGSVAYMARDPRIFFAAAEASAVMDSAHALLLEWSEEHLVSVDRASMLMGNDTWEAHRRADIIMRLVTSLRIAHDKCRSGVFGPPRTRMILTCSAARSPPAGSTTSAAAAATVGEAAVAVATEPPTGVQVEEVAPAVAVAGMTAPTAPPEAEEEALPMVDMLGPAEPLTSGAAGRGDMVTPRATASETTGDTSREAPTELAAPSPRRTAARAPKSLP